MPAHAQSGITNYCKDSCGQNKKMHACQARSQLGICLPVAKAFLSQPDLQPLDCGAILAEDKRLGCTVCFSHPLELHSRSILHLPELE